MISVLLAPLNWISESLDSQEDSRIPVCTFPHLFFVDEVRDPSGLLRRAAVGGTRGHSGLYGSAMCPSVSIAGRGVSAAGLPLRCRALGSGA